MADAPKDRGQWRRNSPSAWIRQAPPVESALTAPSSPRLVSVCTTKNTKNAKAHEGKERQGGGYDRCRYLQHSGAHLQDASSILRALRGEIFFADEHFCVDLVFYNRLLRCYVLLDLKLDKLTHQDLGQMQMYVNYFDRHVKTTDEAPTIGILLCRRKSDALVELTLPEDANIHASEYQLYLPSKEDLQKKLMAWTKELET